VTHAQAHRDRNLAEHEDEVLAAWRKVAPALLEAKSNGTEAVCSGLNSCSLNSARRWKRSVPHNAQAGASIGDIQDVLEHVSDKMARHYAARLAVCRGEPDDEVQPWQARPTGSGRPPGCQQSDGAAPEKLMALYPVSERSR